MQTNVLYYGDNLDILRRYLPDAAVDLVYLDPPFNSNRDDNVIFRDESGTATDAQLLAFEDTWHAWSSARGDLRLPDQHRPPRGPRAGQGQVSKQLSVQPRCLVIASIGSELAPIGSEERERYEASLEVLAKVIEPACSAAGIAVTRADAMRRPGEIPAQVYEALRDWPLVVADVSGGNPNVMYELGLRHSVPGKCTILINEYGRLPFDIQWVRSLQFVRSEIGLVDGRKRLTAILEVVVNEGCDEISATRILNGLRAVEPGSNDQREAEPTQLDEPGFLDILGESEESMPRLSESIQEAGLVLGKIGAAATAANEELEESERSGGRVVAGRLAVAARLSHALDEPAAQLEEIVANYELDMQRVDRGVAYLLDQLEKEPVKIGETEPFPGAVLTLRDTSLGSFVMATNLADSMDGLAAISKVLRAPTSRVAGSLRHFVEISRPILGWAERIEGIQQAAGAGNEAKTDA